MGFRVVATTAQDWVKIAELAGADPLLNIWHPGTSELECESVDQATLDTAFAGYVADQTNIDAATAATKETASRDSDKDLYDNKRLWRAVAELMVDELNVLRALHALPDRTVAQANAAIRNKIDNL